MNASDDATSSVDTHHVAIAVTDTTDAPGTRGSVQDAEHLKQRNGQEPQGALKPQGVGSSTSSQSSEDSLRIEVVEQWEWDTCKCEPKGLAVTKILPGERHLRCFACAKPRGPP